MIAPIRHNCKPHGFQDRTYGANKRVFTVADDKKLRCTVCGKEQTS